MRVEACDTAAETRNLRELEELYAILQAAEHLETALNRDLISTSEYREAAIKLIRGYDNQVAALTRGGIIRDIHTFMSDYAIRLPKALQLLEINKIPTTDTGHSVDDRADALVCTETTGNLITAMDAVKLGQVEIDQIGPYLASSLESLNKHTWLGADFEPRSRILEWVKKCNSMAASDSLKPDDARQLLYDLNTCYDGFLQRLSAYIGKKK